MILISHSNPKVGKSNLIKNLDQVLDQVVKQKDKIMSNRQKLLVESLGSDPGPGSKETSEAKCASDRKLNKKCKQMTVTQLLKEKRKSSTKTSKH